MHLRISPPSTRRSGQQLRLTQSVQQELLDLTLCDNEHEPAGMAPALQASSVADPDSSSDSGAQLAREGAVAIADQLAWQQQEVRGVHACAHSKSDVHLAFNESLQSLCAQFEEIWASPEKQLQEMLRQPSLLLAAPGVSLDLLQAAFST